VAFEDPTVTVAVLEVGGASLALGMELGRAAVVVVVNEEVEASLALVSAASRVAVVEASLALALELERCKGPETWPAMEGLRVGAGEGATGEPAVGVVSPWQVGGRVQTIRDTILSTSSSSIYLFVSEALTRVLGATRLARGQSYI
jgi:hypothetical protein